VINRYGGWLVVTWAFFWPLAIYSTFWHYLRIGPAAAVGDVDRAKVHSAAVKKLGMVGLVVGAGSSLLISELFPGI